MSKAIVTCVGVEIICPECDDAQESPNGSYLWDMSDYGRWAGKKMACGSCGKDFTIPVLKRVPLEVRD